MNGGASTGGAASSSAPSSGVLPGREGTPPAESLVEGVRPHASMMVCCCCEDSVLVMVTVGGLCEAGVPSDGQAGVGWAGQERSLGFQGVAWVLGHVVGCSGPVRMMEHGDMVL